MAVTTLKESGLPGEMANSKVEAAKVPQAWNILLSQKEKLKNEMVGDTRASLKGLLLAKFGEI